MAEPRVQIPFLCSEEVARAFDDAHTRLGYTGLCDRLERLLVQEIEPLPPLRVWRKHGGRQ